MAEHQVGLSWTHGAQPFTYETYSRDHEIHFKGGAVAVMASAAAAYKGNPALADPEDMFVAALSSCHMLSFLAICARKKLGVESYQDDAVGFLENEGGKMWMTRVILRPRVVLSPQISSVAAAEIHHLAHQACFIANSVKSDVRVEPR